MSDRATLGATMMSTEQERAPETATALMGHERLPHHEGHEGHEHEHTPEEQVRRWVDYLGAAIGLLCAVHCALTPLALILSPIAGIGLLWSEAGEELMLWSLVGLALVSGGTAALRSRKLSVAVAFGLSLSLLLLSHELAEHSSGHGLGWPLVSSVLGGVGVTLCHLWSLKLRRARACCSARA